MGRKYYPTLNIRLFSQFEITLDMYKKILYLFIFGNKLYNFSQTQIVSLIAASQ